MTPPGDDPLVGAIKDLRSAIDLLRTEMVRKDVYDAERKADQAEVSTLAEDVKDIRGTMTWLARTLIVSALLPILTSAIVIYVIQQGAK